MQANVVLVDARLGRERFKVPPFSVLYHAAFYAEPFILFRVKNDNRSIALFTRIAVGWDRRVSTFHNEVQDFFPRNASHIQKFLMGQPKRWINGLVFKLFEFVDDSWKEFLVPAIGSVHFYIFPMITNTLVRA